MPTINNTIDIKATRDEVWAVLADMPATRQWLPGVVAARTDGNVRICEMADGQQVHSGTLTVTAGPDPHTATVTVRTTFEPLDQTGVDQLSGIVHGAFQQSLESLRRFVEDDIPWDATSVSLHM